jgi:ribosomal protein S27E
MASERGRPRAPPFIDPPGYVRHRPETTLLYQLVERHYPDFRALREAAGRTLPRYVQDEFEAYLKCGRLEHGFLRVRCEDCHAEKLAAFSCKRRGFCPSCGARRMTDSAALLADAVVPAKPIRQWVLSLPFALRFLLATDPAALTQVLAGSLPLKDPVSRWDDTIVLEPLDFIARLAALVPQPRLHLTRFHGVFAANATMRAAVTPAGRGAGKRRLAVPEQPTPQDIRLTGCGA